MGIYDQLIKNTITAEVQVELEQDDFVKLIRKIGGRVFIVGGFVRDMIRGVPYNDIDYVITGIATDEFEKIFPEAFRICRKFPVYRMNIGNSSVEISFARHEQKSGVGYHGFKCIADPYVSIEDDLFRRDITINAMAFELPQMKFIDPYNGKEDIFAKKIRAVSQYFKEDPVRALRAARQAALFGYEIETGTANMMEECHDELQNEPWERKWNEMKKAIEAKYPSIFFRWLKNTKILDVTFPEIYALIGKLQLYDNHYIIDAFEHSMQVLDKVSEMSIDPIARFCAIVHDIGKGNTSINMKMNYDDYISKGYEIIESWNAKRKIPKKWLNSAKIVILNHNMVLSMQKPDEIVSLLINIHNSQISIKDFTHIIMADNNGATIPKFLLYGNECLEAILSVRGGAAPAGLNGSKIGEWIRDRQIQCLINTLLKRST